MAIHAYRTCTSIVQPPLLRGAGAGRVLPTALRSEGSSLGLKLSPVSFSATTPSAEFHDQLVKPRKTAPHGGAMVDLLAGSKKVAELIPEGNKLPTPAPLPSLTTAFAIRREVFGPLPLTDDGEVRALELHDVVPAGHIAVPITNARWSPHLKPGEFAILDVSDTEPQLGELYGLMIGSRNGPKLHIVQPCRTGFGVPDGCSWYRFSQHRPGTLTYVDGPLPPAGWAVKCRGRVVGVLALPEVARG